MPNAILPFVIIYAVMFVLLIVVAYTPRLFRFYTLSKGILSVMFIVLAILCYRQRCTAIFIVPLLAAFVLAALGDIFIGLANNIHGAAASHSTIGLVGVAFFVTAHLFYIIWFYGAIPFQWYHLLLPAVAMAVMTKVSGLPCFNFGKRRAACVIYYSMIAMMFTVGVCTAVGGSQLYQLNPYLLGTGVALFLASDIILIFLYFYTGKKSKRLRFWNLATYYIGQLLIALCLLG